MKKRIGKNIILILFIVYCAVLAFILFFPNLHHSSDFERSYNLIPFSTISDLIGRLFDQSINTDIVIKNIGMNILLFVPMGLALPALFNNFKKFRKVVLVCFLATLFAESVQYIFNLGSFDVDDIILNTFGGICGYAIFKIPFVKKIISSIV